MSVFESFEEQMFVLVSVLGVFHSQKTGYFLCQCTRQSSRSIFLLVLSLNQSLCDFHATPILM